MFEKEERSKAAAKVERRKSRALMLFGVSLLVPHPLLANVDEPAGLELKVAGGCCL